MSQDGAINLKAVKATYSFDDIELVDKRELEFASEFRLTYEISTGIGLALLGNVVSNFNWYILVTTIIFLGFGIINFFRYSGRIKKK